MSLIAKVTDPLKRVTDSAVLKELARQGIDADYVAFDKDYGKRMPGRGPYAKSYKHLESNRRFLVCSGLPMCDADGVKLSPGWELKSGVFAPKYNLFDASVDGVNVSVEAHGKRITFSPQLFLDDKECLPVSATPDLIDDPVNGNYKQNTLRYDYEWCWRYSRIIEGRILSWWQPKENPGKAIRIKYNQKGDLSLKLGRYAVSLDEEALTTKQLDELLNSRDSLPWVHDSLTVYPDANPESTSVDGYVWHAQPLAWANLMVAAGNYSNDSDLTPSIQIAGYGSINVYGGIWRSVFLFDTSAFPDSVDISGATLSIRGRSKADDAGVDPHFNIFACDPASNTALVDADFDRANWSPSTAFSSAIDYSGWNLSDYNDFTLNASGIAAINKTGVSKFGGMESKHDATGVQPIQIDGSQACFMGWHPSERGTGYKPKLVLTYDSSYKINIVVGIWDE